MVAFLVADILLAFIALRANDEEKIVQELAQCRSQPSLNGPPKHVTGRGSYRHRLSAKTSITSNNRPGTTMNTRAKERESNAAIINTKPRESNAVIINTKPRERDSTSSALTKPRPSTSAALTRSRISEDTTASGRPGTAGVRSRAVGSPGRMSMPAVQNKTKD